MISTTSLTSKIIHLFCLLLLGLNAYAQDTDAHIIPFTGQDYVRVLVETNQKVPNNLKLAVKIIAPFDDQAMLWAGEVQPQIFKEKDKTFLEFTVKNLSPKLWTPAHPHLYQLELEASGANKNLLKATERVGFRSFRTQNGKIYLNDKPIFLRGIAINPPGRGIPEDLERSREFALDYVKFMKSINVNIIRIPDVETWYDVCDELGMMVFGGNYSGTVNGKKPPEDYGSAIAWYKREKFNKIANHPSLMIYALTNEVPFRGEIAEKWIDFLSFAHDRLRIEWDSTRLYIGNAGYGYGRSGDIADLHRYWGWYYNSPYTFLHIRNNEEIFPFKKPVQPITFSESVGNYTGPDGRYNLSPNHKNPVSQLSWTGHAPQNRQANLASAHQVHTFKQATELFRRLRVLNPELSGIFPFTILFHNWHTIEKFMDMDPKAVAGQAKISYSPILISWEDWQSQVYAGSRINPIAHIVNDSEEFEDLENSRFIWQLLDKTKTALVSDTLDLPTIKYYDTYEHHLTIDLPANLASDNYELSGKIIKDGKIISENTFDLFIADKFFARTAGKKNQKIILYDVEGTTGQELEKLGLPIKATDKLKAISKDQLLIIGENSADKNLEKFKNHIEKFINAGGRILVMRQDKTHLPFINTLLPYAVNNINMELDNPIYPSPDERPARNGFHINPESPDHPVFNGLDRQKLEVWSDYTGWDESQEGMPHIYPVTDGFTLTNKKDVAKTAILANYGGGLEGLALIEMFKGQGSILLSGFDLVKRVDVDPVAERLLMNMIKYMASAGKHHINPVINAPIVWGEFETEKGVLTGITSGFMLNSKPILTGSYSNIPLVVTENGHQFAGRPGGWNNRPGLQYVPFGRRTFGPYYHRGFGGVPEPENMENTGEGEFWCRVPVDTQSMMTLVWNPSEEELSTQIFLDSEFAVEKIIKPKAYEWIKADVNGKTNLHIKYMGDRRLIYMETSFN
jgi:hypothetical protein